MNNTVVANNQQDSSFTILDVSGGASATMTNSVIENNGQLQVSNEQSVTIMSPSNGFPDTFCLCLLRSLECCHHQLKFKWSDH